MSLVDFTQEAADHGCLNIAVMAVGEAIDSLYAAVMDQLSSLPPIPLQDPSLATSTVVVFPRFLPFQTLPRWAMESRRWKEFAAHKQVLGVLVVTQCHDVDDLTSIMVDFKEACARFQKTLCDSKCIIFGPKKDLERAVDTRKGFCLIDCNVDHEAFTKEDVNIEDLSEAMTDLSLKIYITLKSRITVVQQRSDNLKLRSPFEGKEGMQEREEVSQDSRHLSRNHMHGRTKKHLGDLYLLCGQLQEANAHYRIAADALKSNRDFLWLGAAYEGQSVTAVVMKKCEEVLGQKAQGTNIRSPIGSLFKGGAGSRMSLKSSASSGSRTSHTLGITRKWGSEKNSPSEHKTETLPVRAMKYSTLRQQAKSPSPPEIVDEDGVDAVVRQESLSNFIDGSSGEEAGEGEEEEEEEEEEADLFIDEQLLRKDFIVDKYSLANLYYSKAGAQGTVALMESYLKFAKYLFSQKRYAVASETLQRMIRINPGYITKQDKLSLYCTMATVYHSINFHRKAALFTHYAARWAIEIAKTDQEKYHAHNLLQQCLSGYKLSLSLEDLSKSTATVHLGWPSLQACILKDFVFLARSLDANIDAIRHTCFLLQTLHLHLSDAHLREIIEMLEDIVKEAREAQKDNKAVIRDRLASPVSLSEFPSVCSFIPQPLSSTLAPHRRAGFTSSDSDSTSTSPFIYSALSARKKKQRPEVLWVQGDPAEIAMMITNPLPLELRVEKMAMISDGIKVDAFPSSLTLPALSEPQQFLLLAIPMETGELNVQGYEATVFGVHNKCMVKIPGNLLIRVIPPLPQLRVRTFPVRRVPSHQRGEGGRTPPQKTPLKRNDSRRSSLGMVDKFELMDGETCKCEFRLDCLRDVPVQNISISTKEYSEDYCNFSWNNDDIQSILPLSKNEVGSFHTIITARIPSWLRVNNDITTSISHPANFTYSPVRLHTEGTPAISIRESFTPTSTPPHLTPSSSPLLKRGKKPKGPQFLAFHNSRRKISGSLMFSEDSPLFGSSLMDSLSLEYPAQLPVRRESNTLPTVRPTQTSKQTKVTRHSVRGSSHKNTADFEALDYNYLFDDLDKRASIRSDPGDVPAPSRHRPTRKLFASDTKNIPIHKSETVAAGMSGMSSEGAAGSVDQGEQRMSKLEADSGKNSSVKHFSATRVVSVKHSSKKAGAITKGNISLPTGPLYKAVPRPPTRKKVVGQFVVEYSGGDGETEGYYRETVVNITIYVKPSIIFEKFDVQPVESSNELFQLVFNTLNISRLKLEVTFTVLQEGRAESGSVSEKTVTLDPEGEMRVVLSLKRFILPECHTLGVKNESNTSKLYCDEIARMVQVQWCEADSQRNGRVSLQGLRLPLSAISIVRPVPLLFDMRLNNGVCPMQGACVEEFPMGEPVTAQVILTNNSGVVMPPSFLVMDPYQFSEKQKGIIKDLSGRMLYTGSLITNVPQLESGKRFEHKVTLLFLYKGIFQLDVKSITLAVPEDQCVKDKTVDRISFRITETPQGVERMAGIDASRATQRVNAISNPSHDSHPVVQLTRSKTDHRNCNSTSSLHLPTAQPLSLKVDSTMHPKLFNTQLHLPTSSRLCRPVCGPHITFHIV